MKDFVFVPIADFKRSEAEGEYKIIDMDAGNNYSCDLTGLTIDEGWKFGKCQMSMLHTKKKARAGTRTNAI